MSATKFNSAWWRVVAPHRYGRQALARSFASLPPASANESPSSVFREGESDAAANLPTTLGEQSIPSTSASKSTAASSQSWQRPVPSGVLPAYDLAMEFLLYDRQAKLAQLQELREEGLTGKSEEDLRKMEIDAWVNDPETRWRAQHGLGDMSLAVFRHLAQQSWFKKQLPILRQRIEQMNITPDVIGKCYPEVDVYLNVNGQRITPGVFVDPTDTFDGLDVRIQVFHPEEKLYTVLLVDPDSPDPQNKTFKSYLHWILPNVRLSAVSSGPLDNSLQAVPFIPPHPQGGTPYHRYTVLVLQQPQSGKFQIVESSMELAELEANGGRTEFNTREWTRKWGARGGVIKGISMFREIWSPETAAVISKIHTDILRVKEPFYGLPLKANMYKATETPRYFKL